jgi:transposase-like protein
MSTGFAAEDEERDREPQVSTMEIQSCPKCRAYDISPVSVTRTGVRHYACEACGNRWAVSVEPDLLSYLERQAGDLGPDPDRQQ